MKKVAIVGVEGSGKTVMLAGLGNLYTRPDADGYFLSPKNFQTASYVMDKISHMRDGIWPTATAADVIQGLNWTLRRKSGPGTPPQDVCEVSFLDFGGEVYRQAFGISESRNEELSAEVDELHRYIADADELVVLINLHDVIVRGEADMRVKESIWITNSILSFALSQDAGKRKLPRASIAITQADSYAGIIEACGGAVGVLQKYLPHVANSYDWLDIYALTAVDKTVLDDDGNLVPARDFTSEGLRPLMRWIIESVRPAARTQAEQTRKKIVKIPKAGTASNRPSQTPAASGNYIAQKKPGFFTAFSRIFDYRGRSSRREFWLFWLGVLFLLFCLAVVDEVAPGLGSVLEMILILSVAAHVSLSVRRCHDVGISGKWILLGIIPYVGWIWMIAVGCMKGQRTANQYGDCVS